MGNINSLIQTMNISCGCSCKDTQVDDMNEKIIKLSKKYNIGILPIRDTCQLTNLYPITDQVHKWNVLIIGNDHTYILSKIYDLHAFGRDGDIVNEKGKEALPNELHQFFHPIWSKTLTGRKLQFYMIYLGKTYFVNTYPFHNQTGLVIGAIMFLRAFELLPMERTVDGLGFTSQDRLIDTSNERILQRCCSKSGGSRGGSKEGGDVDVLELEEGFIKNAQRERKTLGAVDVGEPSHK